MQVYDRTAASQMCYMPTNPTSTHLNGTLLPVLALNVGSGRKLCGVESFIMDVIHRDTGLCIYVGIQI